MTEENKVTENEEVPMGRDGVDGIVEGVDGSGIDVSRAPEIRSVVSVELPFLAPVVEDGYPLNSRCASVSHFKIRLMAMQHYVRCCAERLGASNPVKLFVNVPSNNHGFGSFVVVHLDGNNCVYSMECVSCDALSGMQTKVLTPSIARYALSAEWGAVAFNYEDTSQLQRWGQAIIEHNMVRDYKNTELFDLLANVPPQR